MSARIESTIGPKAEPVTGKKSFYKKSTPVAVPKVDFSQLAKPKSKFSKFIVD